MTDFFLAALLSTMPIELECLAKNVYFESRNQSHIGQLAVAKVVLNRVDDMRYPDTICGVVQQSKKNSDGSIKRHACQFSWYCDGLSDTPKNKELWDQSISVAAEAIYHHDNGFDITSGSTHYHTFRVDPHWNDSLTKTMRIDDHIFYRWE
jgi:N-acetylmuramoyl-L-alanine amidase